MEKVTLLRTLTIFFCQGWISIIIKNMNKKHDVNSHIRTEMRQN